MKLHKRKFYEIKKLLESKLGDDVISHDENGSEFLEIKNTRFWLSVDSSEFTVGYGTNHTHFSEDYGNLYDGIIQVFDLLTHRVKTTDFIKGHTVFRTVVEIEYPDSKCISIGETRLLFYPFWKKTKIETSVTDPILCRKEIEMEVNKIIN